MNLYCVSEAGRKLGINPNRLKRWLSFGYYRTKEGLVVGQNTYRLLSDADLAALGRVLRRIEEGVPVAQAFAKEGGITDARPI